MILDLDPKNTYTKLKDLEKIGLLKSEFSGKQRYFFLSDDFPLIEEYKKIVLKTTGVEESLRKILKKFPKLKKLICLAHMPKARRMK